MSQTPQPPAVIVIGRNEGDRLLRCLQSLLRQSERICYVDSASTDDSVRAVRALGVDVVELDMSIPFSAARARNAGFERMRAVYPGIEFAQFVDGDCEVDAAWLDFARRSLCERSDVAIVCGRRRERFPRASRYNLLCDIEWNTPLGEAEACGGDFMVRADVFAASGGFDPTVIAGEEPELCYRIRQRGWKILRLDHEMTVHDAAITRFAQWWTRTKRAGYAYALVSALHWRDKTGFRARQLASIVAWGGILPALTVLLLLAGELAALFLLLLYPILAIRIHRASCGRIPGSDARLYAAACVVGKVPQFAGVMRCWGDLLLARQRRIIEYKDV